MLNVVMFSSERVNSIFIKFRISSASAAAQPVPVPGPDCTGTRTDRYERRTTQQQSQRPQTSTSTSIRRRYGRSLTDLKESVKSGADSEIKLKQNIETA